MKYPPLLAISGVVLMGAYFSPASADNAASHVSGEMCICTYICESTLGIQDPLITYDSRFVETSSGNILMQCHFDIPEGFAPAKAIKLEGFGCNTPFGPATDSRIVFTPGGEVILTCSHNPSDLERKPVEP